MQGPFAMANSLEKLVDDPGAGRCWRRQTLHPALRIAINRHSLGLRPQIGAIAGNEYKAEMLMGGYRARRAGAFAISALFFQRLLFPSPRIRKIAPRPAVMTWIFPLAKLADPAAKLIRVEVAIAAVDGSGEGPGLEGQYRMVSAPGWPRPVPGANFRSDAAQGNAAKKAYNVDLMRSLIEDRAAALAGDKFFLAPRTV